MTEKYSLQDHLNYRRGVDEQARQDEQRRRGEAEKAAAYNAWVRDGGAAADFERAWPGLRDAARSRRVMDADGQARQAHQQAQVSRI